MFEGYNKIKKCIGKELPFITDGCIEHMTRKICEELAIKCMAFPKSDHMNDLRYVIGDAMEELYGIYKATDEDKFGETIGVGKGVISKILHDGEITKENFTSVCYYLNPPKDLKPYGKTFM